MKFNKRKHIKIVNEYKKFIAALDIIMVLIVLMNMGASLITNIMVVKKADITQIQMKEINPVTAKVSGYEQHPKGNILFITIIFNIILYVVLIYVYMYYRLTLDNIGGLIKLSTITLVWCIIFGMDFFNDLGYLIGFVRR